MGKARSQLELSDVALVQACLTGDNSAYDELVARYQKRVYNYCYRMLGNAEDASDAVQETFLRAYVALSGFRLGARLEPWLYRIAHNVCVDMLRARCRVNHASVEEETQAGREPVDNGTSVIEKAEHGDLADMLQSAISDLPDMYRAVIVMKHFMQMDVKDISIALGIPQGTVKARLHRARRILRKKLAYLEGVL